MGEGARRPVTLETASPFVFGDVPTAPKHAIAATLYPSGDGAPGGPALVLLAAGADPDRLSAHASAVAASGVPCLALDSVLSRGLSRGPGPLMPLRLTEAMMVADAFAALSFVRTAPDIQAERVTVAGLGLAGTAAVLCAYAQIARLFGRDGDGFTAHISVGGPPSIRLEDYRTTGAPITLATTPAGAADPRHRLLAGDLENGGSAVGSRADLATTGEGHGPALPALRLTPDNVTLAARTGRPVRGRLSRAVVALSGAGRVPGANVDALDPAVLPALLRLPAAVR